MRTLGIDTSGSGVVVTLSHDSVLLGAIAENGAGQVSSLASTALQLCESHSTSLHTIDRLVVAVGPGSFTGLRVGIAFAKGIAAVRRIPVTSVSKFQHAIALCDSPPGALIYIFRPDTHYLWLAKTVTDELIASGFITHAGGMLVATTPEMIAQYLIEHAPADGIITVIGGQDENNAIVEAYRNWTVRLVSLSPDTLVSSAAHLSQFSESELGALEPLYARKSTAETTFDKRKAQQASAEEKREIRLRKMRTPDLDAVMAIERKCFSDPWARQSFRETMEYDYSGAFVAEEARDGGWRLVGYTCYYSAGGETHLTNIAVEPSHQRRRIGDMLLLKVIETAMGDESTAVFLEVRPSNVSALAFYERYGFREVHRRKKYYSDPEEDALVMARDFTAAELAQRHISPPPSGAGL